MKIVVDENMPHALELFAEFGEVIPLPGRAITAADLQEADVLLVRSVTRVNEALLATSPRLGFVGTATIGTDHIDQGLLAARGIPFFSAPGCNKVSVGDYVLSALLVLAERHELNLSEMSLAVIGAGNTGESVAGKAEALGMKVLRCDPPLARSGAAGDFVDYRTAWMPTSSASMSPIFVKGKRPPSTCWEPRRSPSVRPGRSSSTPPAARCGTTVPCLSASRDPIPCDW